MYLSNGATLTGTANHPVYISGLGYIAMGALGYNDICLSVQHRRLTPSCIAESYSAASQKARACAIAAITSPATATLSAAYKRYTKRFGKTRTGRFPLAATFTIGTATRLTTLLRIWNAYWAANMPHGMKQRSQMNSGSNAEERAQTGSFSRQQYQARDREQHRQHLPRHQCDLRCTQSPWELGDLGL